MLKCMWLFSITMVLFLQHLHVAVSLSYNAPTTADLSHDMQKLALFQFKLGLSINTSASNPEDCVSWGTPSHPKTMNWSMSSDYCTWDGVLCNQVTGDVIGLDLTCSQLAGAIPSNTTLSQLSSLQYLAFGFNDLHGVFPEDIFHLPNLKQLSLVFNSNLTVILPKVKWGSSSSLQMLNFRQTNLCGGVPDSIGYLESLTTLSLSDCNLFGPNPRSIGNLTQLTQLDLSSNHFSGLFPSWLGNLTQLVLLNLIDNSITGPLPSKQAALCLPNLKILYLSNNLLNGTVPSWLFHCPSLGILNIGHNEFTGQLSEIISSRSALKIFSCNSNLLYGTIPQSFFELVNITSLDLSSNNFSGVLDVDRFSHLVYLDKLDLSHNSLLVTFTSTVMLPPEFYWLGLSSCKITKFPHFLRSLENLAYLDLSNNRISGDIPQWIESVGRNSLYYLNLSQNSLTGSLEHLPWNNLKYLDLQSNMLKGSLSDSLCNVSSLDVLNLSHNNFSGVLPTCARSLNYSLTVFDLRMNNIGGSLPSTLSNFRKLRSLNLHGNKLEGTIPLSFAEFSYLEVIDLGSNQMKDTFPQWLENLQNLQVLILKSNKFHGIINRTSRIEHPFPSLRIIDLSDNEFSGPLPAKYFKNFKGMMNAEVNKMKRSYMGNSYYSDTVSMVIKGIEIEFVRILTVFTTIDLSRNKFEGEIPEYIGNLKSLRSLNLSHNHISGHIPSLIGKLSMLESLDLSSNQLQGIIPQQLTSLNFLSRLNLSQNNRRGHIPEGAQFNTFENDSYTGNLRLCGSPLSKKCKREIIETQHEEDGDNDYFFSGFTWEAVVIGYGSGVVLGFVVGYVMLKVGQTKWITDIIARELGVKVKIIEIRRFL
ncbi:receptor-like protein 33 [Apium graveolens]|uniref:receptor-like protein 33 n=1 Tax=Apium graveolens TaxID=4045 RepID=UPI003D7B9C22